MRTTDNALKFYVREARRADKDIPPVLRRLNTRLENVIEYEVIDVNDCMDDMSRSQRHRYLLQMEHGSAIPIFITRGRGAAV